MLIALIGSRASGKRTMVEELTKQHGFRRISIESSHMIHQPTSHPSTDQLVFQSSQQALDFCTSNWTLDFITTDLRLKSEILPFIKRPWFLLVLLQAPLLVRWARFQNQLSFNHSTSSLTIDNHSNEEEAGKELIFKSSSLEQFIIQDDLDEFGIKTKLEVGKGERLLEPIDEVKEITDQTTKMQVASSDWQKETQSALRSLMSLVNHSITNDLPLSEFFKSLDSIHLPIMRKSLRPCWDTYFTSLANLASLRSNCMKRRVGAVLVTKDNRILSTGYNGTARGMTNCNEGGCTRCNGPNYSPNQLTTTNVVPSCGTNLEECLCLHAEENALLEAGRDRIANSRLYCNTCPCLRCTIKIVQCGVQEVIYSQSYSMDQQAKNILLQAGIQLRQFN